MKRTVLGYLFTFAVILFSFSAVYFFSYTRLKRQEAEKSRRESEEALLRQENPESTAGPPEPSGEAETPPAESGYREADAAEEIRTNSSMVYVVGQYDWTTGIVTETVDRFPEELLGMTRQELLSYLRDHPRYGSLLSFSEHAVYLRRSDSEDWSEYSYYLVLEDGGLMVYYLDRTTLYLDTGIGSDELREEDRELLETGFYIRDTAGLFDYLQTVTS